MKKELQVILEAQLPRSYRSHDDEVRDRQQDSSKAAAQPELSKIVAQQDTQSPSLQQKASVHVSIDRNTHLSAELSKPTPHQGSCASPEYEAHFVAWPFSAPSRGQTSMPPVITSLINHLPTNEERISAKQLWNRSLPVSANVGIIEHNRVDVAKFKEKVSEKYGEGWWRRLEDLASGLNKAAGVIVGKKNNGEATNRNGEEAEGKVIEESSRKWKGPEMKTVESSEGGDEPEMREPNETGREAKEPETKTLDHLAKAAAILVKPRVESETNFAGLTITQGKEAQSKPDGEVTEAAMSLLSLSEIPADSPTTDPEALAASNPLSALWYLIDRFFSKGHEAASYLFVTLEAAIRLDMTAVHALNIPAPPAFWTDAADWKTPKVGMALVLTLASSEKHAFEAFARFSKSLGRPALRVEDMRKKNSASLRKAVLRAKDDASNKKRTTILGVDLRDLRYSQLCEQHGNIKEHFATFARMFVLGVCPGGAKLWLVGGEWGETATVWESNNKVGAALGTWEEMDEFVRAFEGFAVANGQWTSKRFKWFRRCFAVDLKQFDLQIDEEEKKKRGMQKKEEGVKRLLVEIEAWVEIYKIEDVKRGDVGKFRWL